MLQPSFGAKGWKIVRWTDRPGAYWEVIRREEDRASALAETKRLASEAGTAAWAYERDDAFLRL